MAVTEARARELVQHAFGHSDQRLADVIQQAHSTVEQIKVDAQQLKAVRMSMHSEIEDHTETVDEAGVGSRNSWLTSRPRSAP